MGWSDPEILHGKKHTSPECLEALLARTPWPEDRRHGWERKFQQQFVSMDSNPVNDRRRFLVKTMPQVLRDYRQKIAALKEDISPDNERDSTDDQAAPVIAQIISRHDNYCTLLANVERELLIEEKREAFANRPFGLGRSTERQLFELVSGTKKT